MKKVALIGGGLIVVIVVAVVLLVSNLDSLIKTAVEEVGSKATQAKVSLSEVKISTDGKGALRGFTVGNPTGFDTPGAFKLGEVSVSLDVGSVTSDTVRIHEILVAAPEVTYEFKAGGSNLEVLKKNVEQFAGIGGGGTASAAKADASTEKGGGKKLIIDRIVLRDGTVTLGANAPFLKGKSQTVPLPTIELKDIGKDTGGASAGEVIQQVMSQVTAASAQALASLNIGELTNSLGGLSSGAMGALQGTTSGAQDSLKKGAEGATGTLKKMFGN